MLGTGAFLLLLSGQYQAAAETTIILYLTLMPMRVSAHFSVKMPPEFDALAIIFICMSLFMGEVLDFYNRYWWWDVVLHTGSGFLLGIAGFVLVYVLNGNDNIQFDLSTGFISLFAFMFAMGMGAIWEIFEFTMDSLFGMNMQKSGLVDTMWDLIVDFMGALAVSIMGYSFLRTTESDSFLERWIDKLVASNPAIFNKHKRHQE